MAPTTPSTYIFYFVGKVEWQNEKNVRIYWKKEGNHHKAAEWASERQRERERERMKASKIERITNINERTEKQNSSTTRKKEEPHTYQIMMILSIEIKLISWRGQSVLDNKTFNIY